MSKVQPVPAGYHTLTPYVAVEDATAFIAFLTRVFDAVQAERHDRPDGAIMHAEVRVGDSMLMVSEACEQMGPSPAQLYVYVEDADAVYQKAVDAGCTSVMAPVDMFWGDRFSSVKDRWGNAWNIATHIEDVSKEELDKRAAAFAQQFQA
jgi:PhnB protein